jgi:hypothetical protein
LYGECVKTGFRPYDVAVTAALLIAKRYLGDRFAVHSNGSEAQWSDAKRLFQTILGYGDGSASWKRKSKNTGLVAINRDES